METYHQNSRSVLGLGISGVSHEFLKFDRCWVVVAVYAFNLPWTSVVSSFALLVTNENKIDKFMTMATETHS